MSRFSLSGKNAFVTGGSRGIGRAIALGLAEAGADVALTYSTKRDEADKVVAEIVSDGPPRRRAPDGRDRARHRRSRGERRARAPRPDLHPGQQCRHQQADRFRCGERRGLGRVLATNLKGPFVCAQTFLPLLKEAGGGSIVHIGSVSGQYGGPRTAHYAASKAGLISLAQVIARFGAPHGIRSNTVAAGLIASDMAAAGMAAASVQKAAEAILLKRLGTHREVADAVVFLASDASSYITAQTLNVNGGLYF